MFFNQLLYEHIDNPVITGRLLSTLTTQKRSVNVGLHPALLLRNFDIAFVLGVPKYGDNPELAKKKEEQRKALKSALLRILENTARMAPGGRSCLQRFCLHSNAALEEIGPFIIQGSRFPYLREFKVFPHFKAIQRRNFQVEMLIRVD